MDTASARMLGDREIGSLSNVVSQFNVSDDYTQIDYNGKPAKVAALDYAGFFKWIGNKSVAYLAMLQLIQCPCRPPMYNAASR